MWRIGTRAKAGTVWPIPRSLLGMLRSNTVPSGGQYVRSIGRPIHVARAQRNQQDLAWRVRRYQSS
jgi:hypothetical protein